MEIKLQDNKKRSVRIIAILRKKYPKAKTSLKYKNPFHLLIATILAAQCTDKRVNSLTPSLFHKYKSPRDFAKADQKTLEREIRSTGFYRNKAKNIISASKIITRDFSGKVPQSMQELTTLPGVARKTANIVLSSSFRKTEGIAVDTHVKRLAIRLGLSDKKDPDKIEQDLMKIVPREDWIDFNYLLVEHGRKVCIARMPLCPECSLRGLCPSAGKFYQILD